MNIEEIEARLVDQEKRIIAQEKIIGELSSGLDQFCKLEHQWDVAFFQVLESHAQLIHIHLENFANSLPDEIRAKYDSALMKNTHYLDQLRGAMEHLQGSPGGDI